MSLTCEISGESLATAREGEIVVTPSGHVCLKRLLLAKLSETGGMDPFETIQERPLSEDQLISLRNPKQIIPPRPQPTSLPNLLTCIQKEYDALVLELFDTRKALEDTRRELSQALYQNDAAVRVVARISMERDAARQELQQWKASVGSNGNTQTTSATSADPAAAAAVAVVEGEPNAKRQRVQDDKEGESSSEPLENDIPEQDLQKMVDVWDTLHKERKPKQKAAAAAAPTPEQLAAIVQTEEKSWHKTTCKSVTAMAFHVDKIATAAKDKQLVIYDTVEKVVSKSIPLSSSATTTTIDRNDSMVISGNESGLVMLSRDEKDDDNDVETLQLSDPIVNVTLHPSKDHACVATSKGMLVLCSLQPQLRQLAHFQSDGDDEEYTCGALHPDGLIYAAGTKSGKVHTWDFKNKVLAGTLQDGDDDDGLVAIAFSNNGYHLATAHVSGTVRAWDLRKQKTLAILNSGDDKKQLKSVTCLAYDASGKYLAYGGEGGVQITTVKEWGTTASIETKQKVGQLAWGSNESIIITCSSAERTIRFFGTSGQ